MQKTNPQLLIVNVETCLHCKIIIIKNKYWKVLKKSRQTDGNERKTEKPPQLILSSHSSRSLTGFAILLSRLLYSPSSLTIPMGDSRVPLSGANYRLFSIGVVLRCGVSGPHSSQFTHQTLSSTTLPLWKVTLIFNNSLTGPFFSG